MVSGNSEGPDARRRPAALLFLLATALLTMAGCTDKKKKAKKVFQKAMVECRDAEGTFAEVELMTGDETKEILREVCDEDLGKVEMVDEYSAETTVGPYTLMAGFNHELGIWMLKGIEWKALERARRRLDAEDPGENEIRHAAEQLKKAIEEYPASGWIRLQRLAALLDLHDKTSDNKMDPVEWGDTVEEHLEKTIAWAEKNEDYASKAQAQLQIVDYINEYIRLSKDAKENLGNQDEYFKKSIEVAEKAGDEEEAEKYRKDLEKMRKERPEKRKKYDKLIKDAQKKLCGRLAQMKPDGIKDEDVRSRVKAAKGDTDCQALLKEE